jgi:hypothetical protein
MAGGNRFVARAARLDIDPAMLALRMAVHPDRPGRLVTPGAGRTRIGRGHQPSIARCRIRRVFRKARAPSHCPT